MGKSDLLRKLRYLCETSHDVPVALVDMQDYENRPEEFEIIQQLQKELTRGGAKGRPAFTAFNDLNDARKFRDPDKFYKKVLDVRGHVDLTDADVTGGQIGGVIFNVQHAENVGSQDWSEEAEQVAKDLCVKAFFNELLESAHENPVVILFDTVDSAGEKLRRWLFMELLRNKLLVDETEHRVILVLAGIGIAELLTPRLQEHQQRYVEAVTPKSDWTIEQVQDFLRAHGFGTRIPALSMPDVEAIQLALGRYSLTKVLGIAEAYARQES